MPTLAEFQESFRLAVLHPDLVVKQQYGAGIGVYQNTVAKGLIDALRANYPTVERLVGTEWFDSVARRYSLEQLPEQPSLTLYGISFPDFLLTIESAEPFPYLTAVAQLDRCWTEVFFAPQAPVLRAATLQALSPEQLQHLQLQLHPATRVKQVAHSAATIWQHNRPPALRLESLEVTGDVEFVVFTRRNGAIVLDFLSCAEHEFLCLISAGSSLGDALLAVLASHPDTGAVMLARLISLGVFQSCTAGPAAES